MNARHTLTAAIALSALCFTARAQDPGYEIRTLAATPFVYVEISAPAAELTTKIGEAITEVVGKMSAAKLVPTNGVILNFTSSNPDPNEPMSVQVGYPVAEAKAAEGLKMSTLPAQESACSIYTGSMAAIGQTIGELYGEVMGAGRTVAGFRERVLYWEGPDSVNNIVLLELVLEAKGPAPKR